MARKAPTAEQKEKAQERREAFKALAKTVADMPEDARLALSMRIGIVTIEGRPLSPFNSCLLVQQMQTVTVVGGFKQWLAAGRCVMKGQHGMGIWIPTAGKKAKETDQSTGEEGEARKSSFIMGTVFDISQTAPLEQAPAETPAAPSLPPQTDDDNDPDDTPLETPRSREPSLFD